MAIPVMEWYKLLKHSNSYHLFLVLGILFYFIQNSTNFNIIMITGNRKVGYFSLENFIHMYCIYIIFATQSSPGTPSMPVNAPSDLWPFFFWLFMQIHSYRCMHIHIHINYIYIHLHIHIYSTTFWVHLTIRIHLILLTVREFMSGQYI